MGRSSPIWNDELRGAFLTLLRETGNARASARALGHRHLFNNRMQRDPAFRRDCEAAIAAADARLSGASSPFPAPVQVKSMPPDELPEPGDKKAWAPEPVIRRTSTGRTQISYTHEGEWTSEAEAEFLARLRVTGNFGACARAVGFNQTTLYRRMDKWPAFAADCRAALDEASTRLDYKLVAHAHALLRRPGDEADETEEIDEDVPFDPVMALRILGFLDRRRGGRTTHGRRKGPPERTFAQAVESVLAKIAAIERHEKMIAQRRAREAEGGPADD